MGKKTKADYELRIGASVGARCSVPLHLSTLLIGLLLFISSNVYGATFTDEVGRTLEVKAPPRRIISVAPSVTEMLFAVGLEDKIVGVSTHCNYPPGAMKKEQIGGYITPSLEKIISLKPDLVIGTADGELKPFVNKMAGLGIPVYIINPRNVSGVMASIQNIGEITFSQAAAKRLVASMQEKTQTIQDKIKGRPLLRVLHVMAFDPLISSGKGTFVDNLIRMAGGVNIAEAAQGSYPRLSMEEVILQDPEVIILSSMKSRDPLTEQKQWWARWKEISAVRTRRIHVIDADLIHRPSPRIVEGLEETAKAIHPEAFIKGFKGSRVPGAK
ncbi:MAG: cobalamin-binding protein [Proteobacteria bacterium]|nr:cobalamin-binding protein [Pseudomonadota bacterium]